MFKIDKESNRISKIQPKRFGELGFREREHLQEWLANQPDAFGEELLIIQKEFDGFDDTRERLDLLALDKEGSLVVIENKLDDTGRDVMWQALKYASYCSSLTKTQIIEIYQGYLKRHCNGGDAKELLCEFLEVSELDEVVLNSGTDQRLILVAASFRKEVTSAVLWLLSHNIQIQCFKVTPYAVADDLFLNIEQIIPTPEAKELMIGMNAKDAEERVSKVERKNRHDSRLKFWVSLFNYFESVNYRFLYDKPANERNHISMPSTLAPSPYGFVIGKGFARIELYLGKNNKEDNKLIFDRLFEQKAEIESQIGCALSWNRMDDRLASKVSINLSSDCYSTDEYEAVHSWFAKNYIEFENAFSARVLSVSQSTSFNFKKVNQ